MYPLPSEDHTQVKKKKPKMMETAQKEWGNKSQVGKPLPGCQNAPNQGWGGLILGEEWLSPGLVSTTNLPVHKESTVGPHPGPTINMHQLSEHNTLPLNARNRVLSFSSNSSCRTPWIYHRKQPPYTFLKKGNEQCSERVFWVGEE